MNSAEVLRIQKLFHSAVSFINESLVGGPPAALILLLSATVLGQSTAQQQPPEENLSEKVINPLAFLMRVTAENKYSPSLWDSSGEENQAEGEFVTLVEAATLRKAEQTIVPQTLPLTFSQDLPTLTICHFRLCMIGPLYVDFRKLIKC